MIKPCGHRVLVKPDEVGERVGSIILADTTRQREQFAQCFGTIVAVGPNAWKAFDNGEPWAKVGDRVSFAKYGGYVLKDSETREDYRILNDEDIVSVISGECRIVDEVV